VPASYGRIWYWFLERDNSPWYSKVRLFRQKRDCGWEPTITAVAEDLARKLGAKVGSVT